jgi:hypothetical protein
MHAALPPGQGNAARAAARGVGAERGGRGGEPAGQVARQGKFAAIAALLSKKPTALPPQGVTPPLRPSGLGILGFLLLWFPT